MEQEVPVIITPGKEPEATQSPKTTGPIPEQIREISEVVSDAFEQFRESETYHTLSDGVAKGKEYISRQPAESMVLAAAAGFLVGLLFGKRR